MELLIARNPGDASSLPYLLLVPVADGLVFRVKDTWPRTAAIYCHPVPRAEWPAQPELVERVVLRACERRGAAIDIVADRGREQRSQLVFTTARGRQVVFWQAPRTRKQARPAVRIPTARAAGIPQLEIVVDAHERYPYRFTGQHAAAGSGLRGLRRRARRAGRGHRRAEVPPGSAAQPDLGAIALRPGRAGERAPGCRRGGGPLFAQDFVRPALVADGLAELQVRWPSVPLVFCETRSLAEEWTYRFLAAARIHATDEQSMGERLASVERVVAPATGPDVPAGTSAEIRAWARANGFIVSDGGPIESVFQRWISELYWMGVDGAAAPGLSGRPLVLLLAATQFLAFSDRFLITLVAQPLKLDLALSDTQLGVLQGSAFAVLNAAAMPWAGLCADLGYRRTLLLASVLVWGLATLACGLAGSFAALAAARALLGLGQAAIAPAALSLDGLSPAAGPDRAGGLAVHRRGDAGGAASRSWGAGAALAWLTAGGRADRCPATARFDRGRRCSRWPACPTSRCWSGCCASSSRRRRRPGQGGRLSPGCSAIAPPTCRISGPRGGGRADRPDADGVGADLLCPRPRLTPRDGRPLPSGRVILVAAPLGHIAGGRWLDRARARAGSGARPRAPSPSAWRWPARAPG